MNQSIEREKEGNTIHKHSQSSLAKSLPGVGGTRLRGTATLSSLAPWTLSLQPEWVTTGWIPKGGNLENRH